MTTMSRALGWGFAIVSGFCGRAAAEISLQCLPDHSVVTNQETVTFTCTIISTELVTIKGTALDFPCSLPAQNGAMGTVPLISLTVDLNHQDPPFLFGPGGLGHVQPPTCIASATPPPGGSPVMLQPNTPRYLATAVYDVTACDGDFRMHFERFTCPTQQINGTVVSVPLATQPFTQRICFTALESLVTCTPTDCAEPANVVAAPASGTIDARQPHPPHDASPAARQGIGGAGSAVSLTLGVVAAARDCFGFCETAADADLGVNDIANIVEAPAGTYGISLDRPITASAVTTLSYGSDVVTYFSHPGNTNGDGDADADDVVSLVAYLDGDETPPFGLYSTDADHSGAANPADLLRLVDLLLGADLFEPTLHTSLPTSTGCP